MINTLKLIKDRFPKSDSIRIATLFLPMVVVAGIIVSGLELICDRLLIFYLNTFHLPINAAKLFENTTYEIGRD